MPRDFDDSSPPRARRRRDDDDDRPPPRDNTTKTVLIVVGIVGGVILLVVVGFVALLFPAVNKVKEAAARLQSSNNLKQVSLAVMNYEATYSRPIAPFCDDPSPFAPPPGPNAPPIPLADRLSWRVSILPYLEQGNLYQQFRTDQPWHSPTNLPLGETMLKTLFDPLDGPTPETRYRCFYNNGALFDTDKSRRHQTDKVPDGTSNVVLFVEDAALAKWAPFNELKFDPVGPLPALGHPSRDVILVAMTDGSILNVKKSVDPEVLKRLIHASDGAGVKGDLPTR